MCSPTVCSDVFTNVISNCEKRVFVRFENENCDTKILVTFHSYTVSKNAHSEYYIGRYTGFHNGNLSLTRISKKKKTLPYSDKTTDNNNFIYSNTRRYVISILCNGQINNNIISDIIVYDRQ